MFKIKILKCSKKNLSEVSKLWKKKLKVKSTMILNDSKNLWKSANLSMSQLLTNRNDDRIQIRFQCNSWKSLSSRLKRQSFLQLLITNLRSMIILVDLKKISIKSQSRLQFKSIVLQGIWTMNDSSKFLKTSKS